MSLLKVSEEINASQDKVWEIISDLDNEPKFWKGTKSVHNISKKENSIHREITIAFRDSKCLQDVFLEPKSKIKAEFTEGIIKGTKTIELFPNDKTTRIEVTWDTKLGGMMGIFSGMIKKHIKKGTSQALQAIKEEAEKNIG